jgi:hypothetical protein
MEMLYGIVNLLIFITALLLPQFLGLLIHFRIKRFPRLACLIGFVITSVLSLFLFRVVLFSTPEPVKSGEYVCGLAAMAAVMIILFFTGVQALFSIIAQYCFYRKYRT